MPSDVVVVMRGNRLEWAQPAPAEQTGVAAVFVGGMDEMCWRSMAVERGAHLLFSSQRTAKVLRQAKSPRMDMSRVLSLSSDVISMTTLG
ncbi:hypothetical protein Q1695_005152 [Nippostrongylus brasiliensis]|nr:hypothetical protein Q1695_005152 [Nippostrongylus brasiliensis]